MIFFSIDKQRGQVNAERMSRPVDSIKKSKNNQPLVLVLTSMEQSPTFASRLKRKLSPGPILRGAYSDVWAVLENESIQSKLTSIDSKHIAVGIIKGKDGQDYVFNWHSDKRQTETWGEYVKRSKKETIDSIDRMNAEESVSIELKDKVFYNLVYADKMDFDKLRQ